MGWIRSLDRSLSIMTSIALIVMMLHTVLHAVMRGFFQAPITGTNEIVTYYYLPLVALLGIPAAQLKREHITVTLFIDRMGERAATTLTVIACAVGALLSIGFAYFGLLEALSNFQAGSTAGVTAIVTWPIYFLVPLVFALLAFLYIGRALALVQDREDFTTVAPVTPVAAVDSQNTHTQGHPFDAQEESHDDHK